MERQRGGGLADRTTHSPERNVVLAMSEEENTKHSEAADADERGPDVCFNDSTPMSVANVHVDLDYGAFRLYLVVLFDIHIGEGVMAF